MGELLGDALAAGVVVESGGVSASRGFHLRTTQHTHTFMRGKEERKGGRERERRERKRLTRSLEGNDGVGRPAMSSSELR